MSVSTAEQLKQSRQIEVIESQIHWPISYATLQSRDDIAQTSVGQTEDEFNLGDNVFFNAGTEQNELMRETFFGLMDLTSNLLAGAGVCIDELLESDRLYVGLHNIALPEATFPGHSVVVDQETLVGKTRASIAVNGLPEGFVSLNYQIIEEFPEVSYGTFVDSTTFYLDTNALGEEQVAMLRTTTSRDTHEPIVVATPTWDTAVDRMERFADLAIGQKIAPSVIETIS